jgi:WD40 repeat protein
VTADGKLAVSGSADNTLKVWELNSGRELHTLRGHPDSIREVALTDDGKLAISSLGN